MTAGTVAPVPIDQGLLVAAAAANLAGWHDAHLRALGFRTEWRDGLWLTPDAVPPIFFQVIAVRPDALSAIISERLSAYRRAAVSDPWADLALTAQGFTLDGDHPWMVRPVGVGGAVPVPQTMSVSVSVSVGSDTPSGAAVPPGLIIEQVRDADGLADFEHTAALGFGSKPGPAFTWHAPPLLEDPRLQVWRGRVDDETVAVSMGFAEAGVLGIYGVTTLTGYRSQGFGTALTQRALDSGPSLPAVLQPSTMAEGLYGRLGFRRFTTFRAWEREARQRP